MNYYLCFDIGGTAIKYGIIDENANFLETYLTDTEATKGGQHIREKILKLIDDIVRHYNICGVCISTAGMVNPESGEIIYACIKSFCMWKRKFRISCYGSRK